VAREYHLKQAPSATASAGGIDYAAELNEAQLEAVMTLNGPLLCIAGAGSGKTRTLVYRVARLVETGINPGSILLLTFTRKAATSMLDRASALVGAGTKQVAGGTYHAFAGQILRRHGQALGLSPSFTILDESDAGDIIGLIRAERGLNTRETRFPLKATLQDIRSAAVNHAWSVPETVRKRYPQFVEHTDEIASIIEAYGAYKLQHQLVDYDDLLIFLLKLLEEHPEKRLLLNNIYRYIMADEYQDTNILQARITVLLGEGARNVMVVGDDAQSIYSFRGANVGNIRSFPDRFPDCRIIRLEQNYRSTAPLLASTNRLMEHAGEGFAKKLFTVREGGMKPALVVASDEAEQSTFVAQRILELREEGVRLDRIAVLFRSSYHAFHLELELKRRNIPYVKWGGFRFLEAAHIKDLLAHLRILQNPSDRVAWLRVLLLVEGVGPKTANALFERLRLSDDPFDLERLEASPRARAGLSAAAAMLRRARQHADGSPVPVVEAVADYYGPVLKRRYDDFPKRLRDLDQLTVIAGRYATVAEMLSEMALEPPRDSVDDALAAPDEDEERLVLSTVHSAKGLEWHSVFVIWALEGRFPSFGAMKNPADIEEERRLMYVAMTRAQEQLYLTHPALAWDPATGATLSQPSRFLTEIGPDLLERWELRSSP